MASWEHFGEIANVAQLTGIDAVRLIGMIVKAATTARMHKKNCRQFAQHLKLIGNLLEQLKITELKRYPETREPLEQLEDALRRSYRNASSVSSKHELLSSKGSHRYEEWHSDLLGCCSEPLLCIKTVFFPCGTFSKVASVAADRHISSAEACNELMAYSLILSCCCYTCCIRRKLRKKLNIMGGFVDDFLSHLMCCCCALVQEWREVEIRGAHGLEKTKVSPPTSQFMES
uniref:Protein MID1-COMPLEMENTING ACTIVITY 1 n=1 Tax=Nicotiana tabacum TaxID=4097 RepID=A0A1S4AI42_TOBAC|nr:PREDICTED: protein MID1-COMPLEMENTING ACTIVITY 1-like [Nicotiana tabacum]